MSPGKGSMLILNRRMTSGGRQPAGAAGRRRHPRPGPHRLHPRHDRHHRARSRRRPRSPATRSRRCCSTASASSPASAARACCVPTPARDRCTTPPTSGRPRHDESREISRAHHVIDHGTRDGVGGLLEHRRRQADHVSAHGARRGRRGGHVAWVSTRRAARPTSRCRRRPPGRRTGSATGWRRTRPRAAATRSSSASASSSPGAPRARARRAPRLVARRPATHDPARHGSLPGRVLHASRGRRLRCAPPRRREPAAARLHGRALPRHAPDRLGRSAGRAVADRRHLPRHPCGRPSWPMADRRRPGPSMPRADVVVIGAGLAGLVLRRRARGAGRERVPGRQGDGDDALDARGARRRGTARRDDHPRRHRRSWRRRWPSLSHPRRRCRCVRGRPPRPRRGRGPRRTSARSTTR